MRRYLKVIVLIIILSQGANLHAKDVIKFGIVNLNSKGSCSFYKESLIIPLKLKETGFRWGYIIESSKKEFTTYSLSYSPKPFIEVTGTITRYDNTSNVLKSPTVKVSNGVHVECFWNDASDPIGKQKIDIYMNDKIVKTIDFEIIENKE